MSSKKGNFVRDCAGGRMWVSYRLQTLRSERFIKAANRILSGEDRLLDIRSSQKELEAIRLTSK